MVLVDPVGDPRDFGTAAAQTPLVPPPGCGVSAAPERLADAAPGPAARPLGPLVGDGRVPGCAAGVFPPAAGSHDTGGKHHAVTQPVVLVRIMMRLGRAGAMVPAILAATGRGTPAGQQQDGKAQDWRSYHVVRASVYRDTAVPGGSFAKARLSETPAPLTCTLLRLTFAAGQPFRKLPREPTMPEGAAALHTRSVRVRDIEIGNDRPFVLIAGPCALESRDHALEMAAAVKEAAENTGLRAIYKTSFDKANRTSLGSPRGIGLDKALAIFEEIRATTGLPVLTDVHTEAQCAAAAEVVDVLQIPAFLCRQTDLLVAAGRTGKAVNVKKGQFLAPWDMKNVLDKVASTGNGNILQTERGVSFGYNTLVSDMRALPILAQNGWPVVFDATHSVQQPGGQGASSGGQREFVPVLARAAAAIGVAAIFMETHQDPDSAPSDGPNMVPVRALPALLQTLAQVDRLAKENPVRLA